MVDEKLDRAYKRGIEAGQKSDFLDRLVMDLGLSDLIPPYSQEEEVYKSGFQ